MRRKKLFIHLNEILTYIIILQDAFMVGIIQEVPNDSSLNHVKCNTNKLNVIPVQYDVLCKYISKNNQEAKDLCMK